MREFIKVMKALSDPNRVKIVKMLQKKVLCVCEMKSLLEVSQPTVSNHLKILEDADIVQSRKNGLWVDYFLKEDASPYAVPILERLEEWLSDDPDIGGIMERLPFASRDEICRK